MCICQQDGPSNQEQVLVSYYFHMDMLLSGNYMLDNCTYFRKHVTPSLHDAFH